MTTPYEQAAEAHAGKVKPDTLKGAAKYLYKSLTKDQLTEYTTGKPAVLPKKKGNLQPTRVRAARG